MLLEPEEHADAIFPRKTSQGFISVLADSQRKVAGYANIKRTVALAGEDIDKNSDALLPSTGGLDARFRGHDNIGTDGEEKGCLEQLVVGGANLLQQLWPRAVTLQQRCFIRIDLAAAQRRGRLGDLSAASRVIPFLAGPVIAAGTPGGVVGDLPGRTIGGGPRDGRRRPAVITG